MGKSPTPRLLLGLAATLAVVAAFCIYSLRQIEGLRELQTQTIDRNRKDSLQLLRIQNDLNQLALAMRDMLDREGGYPLEAWRGEFERIRYDLDDAIKRDRELANRPVEQQQYLQESLRQFWLSAEQVFAIAQSGDEARARKITANSLAAQQSSLASTVARLLVANNEAEDAASSQIQQIYGRVEFNLVAFTLAMGAGIGAVTLALIAYNRRMFQRLATISEQRSTLARSLIGVQEEVFRSVARDLHDDFGQILTALGVMLKRAEKHHVPPDSPLREDLTEIRTVVQETLEKTRSFSQALHPTVLDDYGLNKAIERYLETWEKQTGIKVHYEQTGAGTVPQDQRIHVYRVLQEALTNVVKHAKASDVQVRVRFDDSLLRLEVEDNGVGKPAKGSKGLGMIAMEERAELLDGRLAVLPATAGGPSGSTGTLVRLEVPIQVGE